jgi:hypothetical protein
MACISVQILIKNNCLEDVDLVIQPVKHTYAQNNYEFSPTKDDFDQLLETSVKALTPASPIQDEDAPKAAELSTGKRKGRRSQNQCRFPRPTLYTYCCGFSSLRFSLYLLSFIFQLLRDLSDAAQGCRVWVVKDNSISDFILITHNFTDFACDDLSNSGTRKGRKRSAAESEMADQQMAEEATHNDSNGNNNNYISEVELFFNDFFVQFPRGAHPAKCHPTV